MKITKLSCAAVVGLVANATGMSAASASSASPATPVSLSSQVAQAIGECRQTLRTERIYSAANLASARVQDIQAETSVTVAGSANQPSFGWMRISYPADGYILTAFLQPCGTPSPSPSSTPVGNACGIVTVDDLTIRTGPSTEADSIDSIFNGDGFRITGGPRTQNSPPDQSGRIWLQISRNGRGGWVPETGPFGSDSGINLRRASCADLGIR